MSMFPALQAAQSIGLTGTLAPQSGPAVSEAGGGYNSLGTPNTVTYGPFALNQRPQMGLIERALPLVLVGGVVWLLTR